MVDQGFLRDLGIDTSLIRRDMDACIMAARYYQEMRGSNPNYAEFAASMLRRAASHALLVAETRDERDKIFLDAAQAYQRLQMPYAYMMLAFVRRLDRNFFVDDYFFGNTDDPHARQRNQLQQQVYILIASIDRERHHVLIERRDTIRESLQPYRQSPIGILGIPIGYYLDLFDSLQGDTPRIGSSSRLGPFDDRESGIPSLERTIQRFLSRYDDALQRVSADRYHWQRLAAPFHPAEPDIYSTLLYTHKALVLKDHGSMITSFVQNRFLSNAAQVLLKGILADFTDDSQGGREQYG